MLRVAAEWVEAPEVGISEDGTYFYRDRSVLTGALALTSDGRDVAFADILVE